MESGKNAETLDDVFLGLDLSENEILCGEVREDGNLGFLCNLNEKCVVGGCSGSGGNGGVEESLVDGFAGNNRMMIDGNDFPVFGNVGDQAPKGEESVGKFDDLLVNGEKVEVPMEKSSDVLYPHEPGSPTKLEVSGDSINLFVEVFGPSGGISDDSLGRELGDYDFKQESSLKESGTLSAGVTGEEIKGEEECMFDVGDLVWVKTRTQLWWPCMVSDPSTAPNDVAKSQKKGSYLVKLYGSANVVWCGNADLKPFVEYFEQMSKQNSSNNFIGSVERAVCEVGLRVQLDMTCPCFLKHSQTFDAQRSLRNKASKSDVVSLSQFQPAKFVADIKNLARSIRAPSKVELIVMKNRLSSFYQSIGHLELHHQKLGGSHTNTPGDCTNSVEGQDDNVTTKRKYKKRKNCNVLDDNITSSDNGSESRERKKSRYLSYPYVDAIKGLEKEDPKQSEGSCSGMESQKRGSKKSLKERHVVRKEDDINASSVDLLAEFCSSALDCSYISRSKYSDSLKRFYSSFRVYSFLDADVATKAVEERMKGCKVKKSKKQKVNLTPANGSVENVEGEKSSVAGDLTLNENVDRKKGRKKKEKVNPAPVSERVENVEGNNSSVTEGQKPNENVEGDKSSVAEGQRPNENVVRKRGRKKKEKVTNSQEQVVVGMTVGKESENHKTNLEPENPQAKENGECTKTNQEKGQTVPAGFESVLFPPNMGASVYPKSPWMISFQQACSNLFKSSKSPKKREGLTPAVAVTKSTPELPDLNGTHPVDHVQVEGLSTNPVDPLPVPKKEGLVYPAINSVLQSGFVPVSSSKDVPSTFQNTLLSNNGVTAAPYQGLNGGLSLYIQHSLQMGSFLSTGIHEPKKRRRRRRRKEMTSEVVSGIPDLNGDVMDTSPLGTTVPEGSQQVPPEGETLRKRRSRYDSGETGGGNIVLNFAAGSVPSKESLVATFSRFGLLKESELEIPSDDSRVKIAYERSSEARFAFRSLEKGHPFGESLLNFSLDSCTIETPKLTKKNNLMLQTFVPVAAAADSPKSPAKPVEKPDIALIRKNVEMMKSTLEKAGDRLSPETRAKLENEIKAFLDKISSSTASSS